MIANVANSTGDTLLYDSNATGGYTLQQHATNSYADQIRSRKEHADPFSPRNKIYDKNNLLDPVDNR